MESLFLNPRPVREMCGEWSLINKFRPFRELRERGRWQKRFSKNEFTLFKNLLLLSHVVQVVKCQMLVDFSTLVFTSSSKDEIRKFHVVVVQRGQINLHRRYCFVLPIQTYCLFCFLFFAFFVAVVVVC